MRSAVGRPPAAHLRDPRVDDGRRALDQFLERHRDDREGIDPGEARYDASSRLASARRVLIERTLLSPLAGQRHGCCSVAHPLMHDREDRIGGAPAGTRSAKPLPHQREVLLHLRHAFLVGQQIDSRRATASGVHCILNELLDDALAGDEVHHAVHRHAHERLAQLVGQRRQPIDDHHGLVVQRRLNGRGPGSRDRRRRWPPARCRSVPRRRGPARRRRGTARSTNRPRLGARATMNCVPGTADSIRGRCRGEHRHQPVQLVGTAPGQERHDRFRWHRARAAPPAIRAIRSRRRDPPADARRTTSQRPRAVERLFERKDRQHQIDQRLHRLDASRSPGPELRADVIHDRHAEPAHRGHQSEIEVRIVDEDEDVGPLARAACTRRRIHRIRVRQHAQDFDEPGDRQPVEVADQPAAGRLEALAAESEGVDSGIALREGPRRARRHRDRRTPRRTTASRACVQRAGLANVSGVMIGLILTSVSTRSSMVHAAAHDRGLERHAHAVDATG